jgi:RNA recognition motif-containing protein
MRLFVGNLSYGTSEEALRNFFEEVGPVASVTIITDRKSGRSKGFGFVEMQAKEDAQEAIERLNSQMLDSRPLTVNEARPPRQRSFGGRERGDGSGGGQSGFGGRRD